MYSFIYNWSLFIVSYLFIFVTFLSFLKNVSIYSSAETFWRSEPFTHLYLTTFLNIYLYFYVFFFKCTICHLLFIFYYIYLLTEIRYNWIIILNYSDFSVYI